MSRPLYLTPISLLLFARACEGVPPPLSFTLGPEVINAYPDGGPSVYQFPDAAFALLPDAIDGEALLFYSDGKTFRVSGKEAPFPHTAPSPSTPVLIGGPPGSYDGNGNWFLHVTRIGGATSPTLLGFSHVENHVWECKGGYGEWNAGAVISSPDNGVTWVREGLAIHDPQPCNATFGGAGYSSIIETPGGGFLAYGGCTAYRSTHPRGDPGTWQRWKDGSFSSPGINGTQDCLVGVPANTCCPIVHYNEGLGRFVMIYTTWSNSTTLFITSSDDGLVWAPSQVLLAVEPPRAIAYGQVLPPNAAGGRAGIGLSAVLAYAAAPPTSGHPRDFVSRAITFAA